jgi:hypothetical protein
MRVVVEIAAKVPILLSFRQFPIWTLFGKQKGEVGLKHPVTSIEVLLGPLLSVFGNSGAE